MLRKVRQVALLWQHFGPKWLVYRLNYAIRQRTRFSQRQLPASTWVERPLCNSLIDSELVQPEDYLAYRRQNAPCFFFTALDRSHYQPHFAQWDELSGSPIHQADELSRGNLRYFEHTAIPTGFPPNWHTNPFTDHHIPADRHWSRLSDFDHGDIKIIWEPSRFSFAYTLVRAYWRTGNEDYPELFWRLVEDWYQHNPPQQGPNWKCGQETTFRVMAWCFGLYGFLNSPTTTAERVGMLGLMIAVSGQRIEANLDYALSQKNNHSISEGVGLWTIGALFPELRRAEKWRKTGHRVLEKMGRELIYDDGSFVQHSVNYHRLMLHDYLWAIRLGDLNNQPFSPTLKARVAQAGQWLYQIQDEAGGQTPYYGQNDGALILPLSNCDYRDFRPVVQAVNVMQNGARCYPTGPWDEDLLWLFGPEALQSEVVSPARINLQATDGGYYTLRSNTGFAFIRCASFRHRPGQADMLHLDLWWRGQNIAIDAGTYSYNAPPPWDNPLAGTTYHNTVTVDDQNQMERVGRFLWLPWLHSQVHCNLHSAEKHLTYWEGEHDGYRRLHQPVCHRRGILRIGDDWWLVVDGLSSASPHSYRLHWLFPDLPNQWQPETGQLTLQTDTGPYFAQIRSTADTGDYSLIRADEDSPRGWHSPYYYYREPALSLALNVWEEAVHFLTLFGPEVGQITTDGTTIQLKTDHWQADLRLSPAQGQPISLINTVSITGTITDKLDITTENCLCIQS